MRAGAFNRSISIETLLEEENTTYGGKTSKWVLHIGPIPAEMIDLLPSRSESVRNGLEVARDRVRVRMRYRTDIEPDMRIIAHGGTDRAYQIVSGPVVIGKNQYLELICEKFTSQSDV